MANFDAALKDNYGPGLRNSVNNTNAFTAEVQVDEENIIGRQAVWAVHTGRSSSTGNRAELAALPTADRQRYSQLRDDLVFTYHTIKVSGPALELTRGDEGAFLRALESEIDGAEKDIKNDYARQIFGQALTDGTNLRSGVMAVLTADPGTGTTWTIANATKAEMRYFFVGMRFQVVNPAGGAYRPGTYTITAVDVANRQLTTQESADASIASGDYVVREGNFGEEINGLRHLISTQKTANLDPATVPAWGAVTAGSSSTQISEVFLNEASEKVQTDGDGSSPNLWIVEFDQRRKLASQLQAQKRYDGMQTTLKSGFKGLDIAEGVLVADRYCPTNDGFGLTMKEIKRFVGLDWSWDEKGGGVLYKSVDDSDSVSARFKAYHQLVATNRNSHVRLTMSTPTF
jgi:hypothetical protein